MPHTPTRQAGCLPQPLSRERERELLAAYAATRDALALDELVRAHKVLVRRVVRRHRIRALREDDLVAEGTLGLVEAAQRFDPSFDVRFATYAAHWVRARVQTYALQFRRIIGVPDTRASRRILGRRGRVEGELRGVLGRAATPAELAAALEVDESDLDDVRASYDALDVPFEACADAMSCGGATAEELLGDAEEWRARTEALARALKTLPPRERMILERRRLACEPAPLHVLAAEMALSRERVRQLEQRALDVLGQSMAGAPRRKVDRGTLAPRYLTQCLDAA